MDERLAILIVEDSEDDTVLLLREFVRAGLHVEHERVETPSALEAALDARHWDAIISDHAMPHFSGLDALEIIRRRGLDAPFIIVSGAIGEEVAVEAMRAGANDYVFKSSLKRLAPAVEREIDEARVRQGKLEAEAELGVYRNHLDELVALRTQELCALNLALERASMMKSKYLSRMSHELRTPLNSIIGFTSVILQGMAGPLTEEQEAQLDMVLASGTQMLNLVDELLDLAKIEAGRVELDIQTIDVAESMQRVAKIVTPLMAVRGLAFGIDISGAPTEIETDADRLEQVLINLLGNAAKFTHSGSVTLTVRTSEDCVCFDVRDTGIGIAPEDLTCIFEQFYQASPVQVSSAGVGLGLAISREIALLLGGDMDVSSELGVGSVFTLRIPAQPG